jgi:hypothetical protein
MPTALLRIHLDSSHPRTGGRPEARYERTSLDIGATLSRIAIARLAVGGT